MADKRRLPVIRGDAPSRAPDEEGEPLRPPWQWVAFGTVGIFAVWLPLAFVAEVVRMRIVIAWLGATPEAASSAMATLQGVARVRVLVAQAAPHVIAFAAASFAGGYLVGRWGAANANAREAALAGTSAALIASVLGWAGISIVPLLLVVIGSAIAWAGGRVGLRKRP